MLNSNSRSSASADNYLNINSVSGTLVKTNEGSKFTRIHMESSMAERFFSLDRPHWRKSTGQMSWEYIDIDIIVLQVMLCGENQFLIEYMEVVEDE